MNADPDPAKAVFLEAVERHAPDEWPAFLDRACAGRPDLRGRVEALLAAHREVGTVPPRHAVEGAHPGLAATADLAPPAERPGAVIGPYKLIEPIGEGGMGTVWMAQQTEPVKRLVAVKLIKAGMDSKQVLARFEAERQALALMDHPNIAKVLDGGTTAGGRPYFVMDLVKGVPITRYCDEHRLTPRQRLELFVPVCQAVQHAHQKGIIHRDIKPSNVLVAQYDGRPVPKVIDFGVAKAAGQPLTDKTLVTGFGAIVGTPEYMSPEQAEVNQLDIDTRSDVYSLGVLLYELLAGSPPFTQKELETVGMLEMLRVIREDEPSKPSMKLSTADGLPTLAANRGTEPAKLTKLVRGELDWIVMKALEKDRGRRYETANGFAADVQRYLADEAVLACPASAGYRLRKFARRNTRTLAAAAVLGVSLMVAGVAVAWSVGWANRDRAARQAAVDREATLALDEAERWAGLGKWSEALSAVKQAEGTLAAGGGEERRERARQFRKDVEMVLRLEEIPAMADGKEKESDWGASDRAYAEAFAEYGIDVAALPPDEAVARIRARPGVAPALTAALDDWALVRGLRNDQAGARALIELAQAADPDPWRRQVREACKQRDRTALAALATSPDLSRQPPNNVAVLATALRSTGLATAHVEVLRRVQRQHPGNFWINWSLASALSQTRPDEAISFYRAALAVRPESATMLTTIGALLSNQGKSDEAVACFEKAIELSPKCVRAYNNLGIALQGQKKLDGAITAYTKAIELDPNYASARGNLGTVLDEQGKPDEAIAAFKKAIELDPKYSSLGHYEIGATLHRQKKLREAAASFKKAIEANPKHANAYLGLGEVLFDRGKPDDAIAAYYQAIELDPKNANYYESLGYALRCQNKPGQAAIAYRKALELDPKLANGHNNLGTVLFDQNKLGDAMAAYKKALELDPKNADAYYNIGLVLRRQKKGDEAIAAFRKAAEFDTTYDDLYRKLGDALAASHPDEAIICFNKALTLNPKLAAAHAGLGQLLKSRGKPGEAVRSLCKAAELDSRYVRGLADDLREVARRKPDDPYVHYELGSAHARLGRWKEAAAAFDRVVERDPKNHGCCCLAAVAHAAAGDRDGYRRTCHGLLERFAGRDGAQPAEWSAKACLLLPDALDAADAELAQKLATRAVTGSEKDGLYHFFAHVKGLGEYRAGRYDEAVKWEERAAPRVNGNHWDASRFAVQAMAYHRRGYAGKAREALARARAIMANMPDPAKGQPFAAGQWEYWVTPHLLCREAEELITGVKPRTVPERAPAPREK